MRSSRDRRLTSIDLDRVVGGAAASPAGVRADALPSEVKEIMRRYTGSETVGDENALDRGPGAETTPRGSTLPGGGATAPGGGNQGLGGETSPGGDTSTGAREASGGNVGGSNGGGVAAGPWEEESSQSPAGSTGGAHVNPNGAGAAPYVDETEHGLAREYNDNHASDPLANLPLPQYPTSAPAIDTTGVTPRYSDDELARHREELSHSGYQDGASPSVEDSINAMVPAPEYPTHAPVIDTTGVTPRYSDDELARNREETFRSFDDMPAPVDTAPAAPAPAPAPVPAAPLDTLGSGPTMFAGNDEPKPNTQLA